MYRDIHTLQPYIYGTLLAFYLNVFLSEGTTLATFADNTATMAVGGDVVNTAEKLQRAADQINNWTRQWLFNHFIIQLMHNI